MPAIWAALTAVLANLVRTRIGFWIMSALTAFGLQLVTSKFVVTPALDAIKGQFTVMGADAIGWLAYAQVDKAITITLSAYAAAATFSAVRLSKATT